VELPVQALSERELFRVGERLIAEDEHGEFVQARADFRERCFVTDGAELDRTGFADENRVELPE